MKSFFYGMLLSAGVATSLWGASMNDESSIWLIQEDFIKFGKKEVYESQQQMWLQGFKKNLSSSGGFWRVKKNFWPIYGLQALDEPQYIYLIPLKDTQALGDFFARRRQYELELDPGALQQRQILLSTLNFSINSLHEYIKECSRLPNSDAFAWEKNPFIHYWVFGITPGNEKIFEQHLQKLATDSMAKNLTSCWRTWRVLLGADTPKYVIVLSAVTQTDLDNQIKTTLFLEGNIKDIVRNQREGAAMLKTQLSLTAE